MSQVRLEGWGLVDEGCELEGVGGFGVGGGFVVSGFLAGLGAVGCEAGAGAAVGVGVGTGVVVGLVVECSVNLSWLI